MEDFPIWLKPIIYLLIGAMLYVVGAVVYYNFLETAEGNNGLLRDHCPVPNDC
jgi:hypothetical protein